MKRLGQLIAIIVLAFLVFGVPTLLMQFAPVLFEGGTDITQVISEPVSSTTILKVLAAVTWFGWFGFIAALVLEGVNLARGAHYEFKPLGPMQVFARRLLFAALAVSIMAPGMTSVAQAITAPDMSYSIDVTSPNNEITASAPLTYEASNGSPHQVTTVDYDHDATNDAETGLRRVVVRAPTGRDYDCLWDIAERHLGDGTRWKEIARLNKTPIEGGVVVKDPDLIYPGWNLRVPNDAVDAPLWHVADGSPTDQAFTPEADHDHVSRGGTDTSSDFQKDSTDDELLQPAHDLTPAVTSPGPVSSSTPSSSYPNRDHAVGLDQVADDLTPQPTPDRDALETQVYEAGLPALAVGGVLTLLAGGVASGLVTARRRRDRHRRPGRLTASTPAALLPIERDLSKVAPDGTREGRFLNQTFRHLTGLMGSQLPDVRSAVVSPEGVTITTAPGAVDLPAPWQPRAPYSWFFSAESLDQWPVSSRRAPYPSLVTVGYHNGNRLMIDVESARVLHINGPRQRAHDLMRLMAAELSTNVWSDWMTVSTIGFGEELLHMNPDRITVYSSLTDALKQLRPLVDNAPNDVLASRADSHDEAWAPHIVLISSDQLETAPAEVSELASLLQQTSGRKAFALIMTGDAPLDVDLTITVNSDGTVAVEELDLAGQAGRLTPHDGRALATLLATARDTRDVATPAANGEKPWQKLSDVSGSIRRDLTEPRDGNKPGSTNLMGKPDTTYIAAGATTVADLQQLAPSVPPGTAARILESDPDLDADVSAWLQRDDVAKVRLLGPLAVSAPGKQPPERLAYYTEVVAYLATRSHGATTAQLSEALGISAERVGTDIGRVRSWLGINPDSDTQFLPRADRSSGTGRYCFDGVLIDADLLRRLRLRSEARGGHEGLNDLVTALNLVAGRPFDELRVGGGRWLELGERVDLHLTAAIVDIAHIVVTAALAEEHIDLARWAAEAAHRAAPDEEIPMLDLAAVKAHKDRNAAAAFVRRSVTNRSDDDGAPDNMPDRSDQILTSKDWMRTG